jgi:hypothetical protein
MGLPVHNLDEIEKSRLKVKVRIKSFSNNAFSRKRRDKGGEGIDTLNRSNIVN